MDSRTWWYLARSSGIVAWAMLAASVIWGLLISTRLSRGKPTAAWLTDLHRFLGASAMVGTGLHLAGLVADNYVHFGLADLLVPYASPWKPGAVALGVVALYLLVTVEVTSLLMRRIPRRWWKRVHLGSFVLFWIATLHLAAAGTDATNPALLLGTIAVGGTVVFLTVVRVLSPKPAARRSAAARSASEPRARSAAGSREGSGTGAPATSRSLERRAHRPAVRGTVHDTPQQAVLPEPAAPR